MKKVFILGAGPAGMALADGLSQNPEIKTVLIEAAPQVGGLAQTMVWSENGSHDLGPHKLFTTNKKLEARVRSLLPMNEWLLRPKISRIYMRGQFLPYPPSPFSVVKLYGALDFLGMGFDFAMAKITSLFPSSKQQTFESDLAGRVGQGLYEKLFKPIAVKLWGDPKKLDAKLSKSRVQTPSLMQLLAKSCGFKTATQTTEALEFFYPQGGLGRLWSALIHGIKNREVFLNHRVTGLEVQSRRVIKINAERSWEVGAEDWVISTLPITVTASFLKNSLSPQSHQAIQDYVVLNDLILVFLKINKTRLMQDAWVFVPDATIPFHRVSEQAAFDPGMTPRGSIVCCEIMSHADRPFANKSDDELRKVCVEGLTAMGFDTQDASTWESRVIRLPKSYPVYRAGYETAVEGLLKELDGFENFKTVGRQGSFNYIGSLDAMDIGYGTAEWLLDAAETDQNQPKWQKERERTAHFPVLD